MVTITSQPALSLVTYHLHLWKLYVHKTQYACCLVLGHKACKWYKWSRMLYPFLWGDASILLHASMQLQGNPIPVSVNSQISNALSQLLPRKSFTENS